MTRKDKRRRTRTGGIGITALVATLALTALTAPTPPITAQDEPAVAGEIITVELVDVDVWVSDPSGEPLAGLERGDFEVFHDGRPVALTHFREMRGGRAVEPPAASPVPPAADAGAGPPPASMPPAAPATHVAVYFDQSRIRPTNYKPLIAALRELLQQEAIAPERVLVLRQRRGLAVEQPFGSSRQELEAALTRIEAAPAAGFDADTETRLAVDAIREAWDRSRDSLGSAASGMASIPESTAGPGQPAGAGGSPRDVVSGGFGTASGPDACGPFLTEIQPTLAAWAQARSQAIETSLANLTDAASFLAGLPGVKMLLYLSDGLETQPGTDLANYAAGLCPAGSGELLTGVRSAALTDRFLELTRHANANRVTVHALQTTGLRGSSVGDAASGRRAGGGGAPRASRAFESSRRGVERAGLSLLAAETGGRAIFNRNELGSELARIGRDAGNYYSLAYEPPAGSEARGHRIEVRVRRDKAVARYRRGYVEKDSKQWLGERVEGALNLGITDNALGVRLAAAATKTDAGGGLHVPLHVIIPAERLAFLPRGDGHVARVSIKVMARAAAANTLTIWDRDFQVKGAPGATGWADLTVDLELPAGTYVTAVGVRDETTGEASFLATTLETGAR